MSTVTAEYGFTAQLASLTVAAGALLLVTLRSRVAPGLATTTGGSRPGRGVAPRAARWVLAAGLVAMGLPAVIEGAQLLGGDPGRVLGLVRVAAGLAVVAGSVALVEGRAVWVVRAGGVALVASGLVQAAGAGPVAVDSVLVASAVIVAAAVVSSSRSSVAAQVAVGSAAVLLAVVVVLSIALASVVTSALQRTELQSVAGAAGQEAAAIDGLRTSAAIDARAAALDLSAYFPRVVPDPLVAARTAVGADADSTGGLVAARLAEVADGGATGSLAYLSAAGEVVATSGMAPADAQAVADATATVDGCGGTPGTIVVVGGRAMAVASSEECLAGKASPAARLGTVLCAIPVDPTALAGVRAGSPAAVAVVAGHSVLGVTAPATVPRVGADVLVSVVGRSGGRVAAFRQGAGWFALQPVVGGDSRRVATIVAWSGSSSLDATRQRLLRTLFVVAAGGTALALLLAVLIGDHVTAGLRRLTAASGRLQSGDTSVRAGIEGPDEVGALATAFDAMVVSIEDKTVALRQAADDEARLRDRLEAIVAGMGDALVAVDTQGLITDVNPAALALLGIGPLDALGRAFPTVVQLRDPDGGVLDVLPDDPPGGHVVVTADLVAAASSSGTVPVGVSVGTLPGPLGAPTGSVVVVRDLRAEREVERMKTEFLSRVGHELRTPLTGILGYAELLVRYGDGLAADRAQQWHGEVLGSAKRLVRIVEMLEFFAGAGAGRVTLRREPIDVGVLVDGVIDAWRDRLPEGATLGRRIARGLPAVCGDRRWLGLAVEELVDNAVKFSPDGGRISLRAAAVPGPGAPTWVEIAVADHGKGMTPGELELAFADFSQGDTSDTRAFGGLGLGLALVRRVVDGQGGTVTCTSRPGGGSTVTLRLPAEEPSATVRRGPPEATVTPGPGSGIYAAGHESRADTLGRR